MRQPREKRNRAIGAGAVIRWSGLEERVGFFHFLSDQSHDPDAAARLHRNIAFLITSNQDSLISCR